MRKLFLATLLFCYGATYAQSLKPGGYAPHIARITNDSIIVVTGSTYEFSVDTHEDSGLVSTGTTVKHLLTELVATNLRVTDRSGHEKTGGSIVSGDRLVAGPAIFHIGVVPAALGGKLQLIRDSITTNISSAITLQFTAGQRTPNASVRIFVPAGINITAENTTVNVIGRGAVKLHELATQYIGRVTADYPYQKVGNFAISKLPDSSSVLLFRHLDLRPANGADLVITINNVKLSRTGKYLFKAAYATVQPQVLTSETATATLTAVKTVADFQRDRETIIHYPETYTTAKFTWSPVGNKHGDLRIMQSTDQGKIWTPVKNAAIDDLNATAVIKNLLPGKLYCFRLAVLKGSSTGYSNTAFFYSGKPDVKKNLAPKVTDNPTIRKRSMPPSNI